MFRFLQKKNYKLICLLVYFAVLLGCTFFNFNDAFLSDDYDMIYRIGEYNNNPLKYLITNRDGFAGQGGLYRPTFVFSFWLNYVTWNNAWNYHALNFILHLFSSYFIFLVMQLLLQKYAKPKKSRLIAFLCALLFLISPMHSESITWISGRTDLLCFFFMIFCWLLLLKFENSKKIMLYVFSLLLFFISLLAKEMSIVFPAILSVSVLLFYFARNNYKQKLVYILKYHSAFYLVIVVYLFVRAKVLGTLFGGYGQLSYFENLKYTIKALIDNFSYFLFHLIGPVREQISLFNKEHYFIFAFFLLILVSALGFVLRKQLKFYIFCLIGFLLFLLPVINLPVQTYDHSGQRITYFSSLFFYLIIALLFYKLIAKHKKVGIIAFIVFFIINLVVFINLNLNWQKASQLSEKIINDFAKVVDLSQKNKLVVLALPDNVNGAYIFRNCFFEAVKIKYNKTDQDLQMLVLPYKFVLDNKTWDQNLIAWEQTKHNFMIGTKILKKEKLIMAGENYANENYSSKLLNFDSTFNVGDKIWIEWKDAFLSASKENPPDFIYYNNGTLEQFEYDFN